MSPEQVIPLAIPVVYPLLLASEARIGGRHFPDVKYWKTIGVAFFVSLLLTSLLIPVLLPVAWLKANRLLDLATWGFWGVPIALLLTTLVTYLFHRAEHRFDWMWLAFHQLHHSAERVDLAGAFYTHPFEPLAKMALGAIVALYVLGLDPIPAATTSTLTGALSMFQHWNVKTPHWLGYIVPRPESHCLHHERGVHARNYGDLPIWDMLFGTYLNPVDPVDVQVGFGHERSARLTRMLLMRPVDQ